LPYSRFSITSAISAPVDAFARTRFGSRVMQAYLESRRI
jgi:hypothetical protein